MRPVTAPGAVKGAVAPAWLGVVAAPVWPAAPARALPVLVPAVPVPVPVLVPDALAPAEALGDVELAGAGVMTVLVIVAGLAPESPASLTREAASTPSASTITTARAAAGGPQLGDAARRVRAAAPQRRHQS